MPSFGGVFMDLNDVKSAIEAHIDSLAPCLAEMSDDLFDHPELGFREFYACKLLTNALRSRGFEVETPYAGLDTAFRAVWRNGKGGPNIGLLCEYDALPMGHGCSHHLQGPSCIGAAVALKERLVDVPYTVEVIGTPAEEIEEGGKTSMLANGAFRHHDIVLMMHGGNACTTDIKSMALSDFRVTYSGVSSHSAIAPDKGRSALEALMLASNGIAYLRGHVLDDTRMAMIVEEGGSAVNAIVDRAVARIELRSYNRDYLDQVIARVDNILQGAALMTETTYDIVKIGEMHSKIPVLSLNDMLMKNARHIGARQIGEPRRKTGATDFASVMRLVPGSCIRTAFVPKGTPSHSQAYLDAGKSADAHRALAEAAKILALTGADLICEPENLRTVKADFADARECERTGLED